MKVDRWTPAKAAVAYIAVAGMWIVGSDLLIGLLPPALAMQLQTVKGLLFIAVTGGAFYVLASRIHSQLTFETRQARSLEALLEQVISTVPVGVLFINSERVITFLNPTAEHMLSMSSAESVGKRLDELCCAGDPDRATRFASLLSTGVMDGMMLGRPDEEAPRAVIARAAEVTPASTLSGWVIALADITEVHQQGARSERLMRGYRFLSEALALCARATEPAELLEQVTKLSVARGGYRGAWAILRASAEEPFSDVALVQLGARAPETASLLREQASVAHGAVASTLFSDTPSISNHIGVDPANPWSAIAAEEHLGSSATFGVSGPSGMRASVTFFSAEPGFFDAEEVDLLARLQGALAFAFEKIGLERRRAEAEQALVASEHAYRQLFDSHPAPLWVYDRATLRFLSVNDAAVNKYGYSRDEFAAMTLADIRPPADVPDVRRAVERAVAGFEDAGIWTHVDKRGRTFPVHIFSHGIEWEGHDAEMVLAQEVAQVR